jgi:hypothetical protein
MGGNLFKNESDRNGNEPGPIQNKAERAGPDNDSLGGEKYKTGLTGGT